MKKILIILFLTITIPAIATKHYVATDGNDSNAGDLDHPWLTWQKGFDEVDAGDTLYIRGGTYTPATPGHPNFVVLLNPDYSHGESGTAENPILISAYPGEYPILDCRLIWPNGPGMWNVGMALNNVHYITFYGLEIRNVWRHEPYENNYSVGGVGCSFTSNLTFERFTLNNIGGKGFGLTGLVGEDLSAWGYPNILTDTTKFINCDVIDCADSTMTDAGNAADGWFYQAVKPGGYYYFYGCRAIRCSDDGFNDGGASVFVYVKCWAVSNGYLAEGNGEGFKSGGICDTVSVPARYIRNCLMVENSGSGLFELDGYGYPACGGGTGWTYRTNERVYNNFAYNNGAFGYRSSSNDARPWRNSVYTNNIAYSNDAREVSFFYGTAPESYNTWDWVYDDEWFYVMTDSVTVTNADFVSLDVGQLDNTRKSDGSLPTITFGTLVAGSDLIDAGTSQSYNIQVDYEMAPYLAELTFVGAAPDMGYAEYGETEEELLAPSVTTEEITTYNAFSATISGTITDDGMQNISASGIAWGTSPNPTTSGNILTNGTRSETTFSNVIRGLRGGQTYYFRAYATNPTGTSYGANIELTTPDIAKIRQNGKGILFINKHIIYK